MRLLAKAARLLTGALSRIHDDIDPVQCQQTEKGLPVVGAVTNRVYGVQRLLPFESPIAGWRSPSHDPDIPAHQIVR